jgi:hypothetical protein
MANYSHKTFFRKTPNIQLEEYFKRREITLVDDFEKIKESDVEALFTAYNELSEDEQGIIEAQFQEINARACEGGIKALVDEAEFHHDDDFADEIAVIDGLHAKSMWAFLEKPDYWLGANRFLEADNVAFSFWKKRSDLPNAPPYVDDEDIQLLAQGIGAYFRSKEGRGKNCKVEPYRRNDLEYFFAYPEDYAQSGVEWVSSTLKTRARHPAFEIIFVYCESEGSLDIYARGNTKAVPDLQGIFAKSILRMETLPNGTVDKRVYDLKPIADKNFEFKFEPELGIDSVAVTRLRLKLSHGDMRRITLEANARNNPRAVYDLLDEINTPDYFIDQIGVLVTFESVDGKRAKTKRFNISYPNSCALSYDGNDLKVRQMLAQSGLEPRDETGA